MTRPRRSSAELCRSKQRRCKRIWIACAMSPRVVKKTAGSGEPPLAAAQMGRATAREVEGSWGIHSTLTAWRLWPSRCPRGGPPGLWGLGLPWLRGLWNLVSAAAWKTLSRCRDAGSRKEEAFFQASRFWKTQRKPRKGERLSYDRKSHLHNAMCVF